MALEMLQNRGRAAGIAGTVAVHATVVALLLWFGSGDFRSPERKEALVAFDLRPPPPAPPPPPPPPPDRTEEGAAAPPSRGRTAAPSPPPPTVPLAQPTPAEIAAEPGSGEGAGLGAAPGSGAGQGGKGVGSGSGESGAGRGSGIVSPPIKIAGQLSNADYRAARAPRGAAGTVRVSFRVRSDGAVDRCVVTGPSGYPMFDQATCRLIQQRFRYRPAHDADGRALDWEIRTDYTWAPR
jgi:protein TonB